MKLNHLNLAVTDVAAAEEFLTKYFGMRPIGAEPGQKKRSNMAFLFDDDQFVLTLIQAKHVEYPKTFHIGFAQESPERVNEINQRLRNDGFDVPQPEQHHAWTFYVQAPGGFMIEVLA